MPSPTFQSAKVSPSKVRLTCPGGMMRVRQRRSRFGIIVGVSDGLHTLQKICILAFGWTAVQIGVVVHHGAWVQIPPVQPSAALAQLAERLFRKQGVLGSRPRGGSSSRYPRGVVAENIRAQHWPYVHSDAVVRRPRKSSIALDRQHHRLRSHNDSYMSRVTSQSIENR